MKILTNTLASILLVVLFLSCSDSVPEGDLLIRVKNTSIYNYQNVQISTSGELMDYGDLSPDEISEYRAHEMAYGYCYVELLIDNDTFYIQPIDFVGETPLSDGKYTYEISADGSNASYGRLTMVTVED